MRGSRLAIEVDGFLEKLESRGLSREYLNAVRSALCRFKGFCELREIGCVKRIDPELVGEYMGTVSAYSSSYQRFVLSVVKRFLAYHKNVSLVDYRPLINGSSRMRVDWLTPEECKKIFDTDMQPDQSVLIGAGILQGLRRKETIRMTVGEARWALSSKILSVRGKTGPRSIPLHQDFGTILERYLAGKILQDDRLLLNMKRTKSERQLNEFCQRYGKKFGFHTLRRSFGRNLWLLGVPIETISELYGHSSVDMTREYLGVGISDMGKALSKYSFGIAKLSHPEPEKSP